MELGQRIKSRRELLQMSQEELAKKTGYRDRSSIAKIEQGVNDITQSKIVVFAKALGTTPAYLMGWEDKLPDNILPMPKMNQIPLVGTIACGTPILAVENIDDYVDIPEHVRADFALRCKGDSMINARIFDGDIVYIRKQETVNDKEIAAVLLGEEATLKRVKLFADHITLEAANPMVEPITCWREEMNEVRILGKAVAFTSAVR